MEKRTLIILASLSIVVIALGLGLGLGLRGHGDGDDSKTTKYYEPYDDGILKEYVAKIDYHHETNEPIFNYWLMHENLTMQKKDRDIKRPNYKRDYKGKAYWLGVDSITYWFGFRNFIIIMIIFFF